MEIKCTSSNRDMILHVLQNEVPEPIDFQPSPSFACSIGEYTLLRDGRLTVQEDTFGVFPILAALGLCDQPHIVEPITSRAFVYSMTGHSGRSLLNLFSIISSRQLFLNRALSASKAFYVLPSLMDSLIAHPPITVPEFIQVLYGREHEYGGIKIDLTYIELTGFRLCKQEETDIHHQLADLMMDAALSLNWVKPYTRNIRNKKYAFRTWLNSIGMIGPEYKQARQILLGRLYGQSDRRSIRH